MEQLIHILFDKSGAEALQKSFQLDDIIEGEIVLLEDDLSVGPLQETFTDNGVQTRQDWWTSIRPADDAERNADDATKLQGITEKLQAEENTEVWIWAAQNARDVCGYYAVADKLPDFQGRVHIIYLNNLPFINEKGAIFYPTLLNQIQPKEFLKARKLAREITPSEFEVDREEWARLVNENQVVRILEGGKKIKSEAADFFDKELLANAPKDFQRAFRITAHTIHRSKHYVGEDYLLWRLKELVAAEKLDCRGELKAGKDFEVKIKSAEAVVAPGETESND